jgi:hypothetical protein
MSDSKRWFKAKTIGWGWGLPLTWQGWVAYALYCVLLTAGVVRHPPDRDLPMFLLVTLGLTGALVILCMIKGEKPGSRRR